MFSCRAEYMHMLMWGKVMLQELLTEEQRVHRCSAHCKSGLRHRALSIPLPTAHNAGERMPY